MPEITKMSPGDVLTLKIDAEFPIIQFVTYEWRRLFGLLVKYLNKRNSYAFYWWNAARDLRKYDRETQELILEKTYSDPVAILNWFLDNAEKETILVVEDFHLYFDESYVNRPQILSQLKEIARFEGKKKTLILLQPVQMVPIELSKDIFVYELSLPDTNLLKSVLEREIEQSGLNDEDYDKDAFEEIAEAALGLTVEEAKMTFKEIINYYNEIRREHIKDVISQKEQIIKKSGVLEYFHQTEDFNDVGGMENLKEWLLHRREGFRKDAKEAGLRPPKGVLLLGIPGGGKSLIAKAIASVWNLPLLKFDLGKVFAGVVGASEANIRKAISIANAVAPSILWIDEIEKGLSGVGSSDVSDAGTTARVFGTMLTWMQEKTEPVFVIATANDISKLPPELLRKGRFDEIFFVDLPSERARKEIWEIHLKKRLKSRYNPDNFDFEKLIKISEGFTGAEIEEAVNDALYHAYSEGEELNTKHLIKAIKSTYPLSKVMAEDIMKLRKWAKYRARFASEDTAPDLDTSSKEKIPRIKGEKIAIFDE